MILTYIYRWRMRRKERKVKKLKYVLESTLGYLRFVLAICSDYEPGDEETLAMIERFKRKEQALATFLDDLKTSDIEFYPTFEVISSIPLNSEHGAEDIQA